MPFVPKVPDSCDHLDLDIVVQTLTEHYGGMTGAAKKLGVSSSDLRRLTWAKPHLLDKAHEEMEVVVARAMGEVIQAIYSDDPDRQMWGADKMLSSYLARNDPLAPARRR